MAPARPNSPHRPGWTTRVASARKKTTTPAAMLSRRLITTAPKMALPGIEPGRPCDRWILSPLRLPVPPEGLSAPYNRSAAPGWGKIGTDAFVQFSREPDALAQGRVRMDGAADVLGV